MSVIFEKVRLSFPRIIVPEINKSFPNSPPSYSCNLIFPKNHPAFAQFMAEVNKLAQEKWKEHAGTILQMANGNKKLRCYGAGEEIVNTKTYQVYEGYPGMAYLSPKSDKDHPPQLIKINPDGTRAVTHDMEREAMGRKMYGGCYVNVLVSPWLQDNAGGKAVRCNLLALEFAGEGEPLGESAAVDALAMFGSIPAPVQADAAVPAPAGLAFPSFMS